LGRGYAIATRADGRAVRSVDDIAVGDEIGIRLGRGRVLSRVLEIEAAEERES